jgi:hypothetical protein
VVVLTAFVAVSLTACSGGGGSVDNNSSSTPDASPSSPVDPSLKVPAPLPTQELLSNPCSALTDAQLKDLGLAQPGKVTQGPPALWGWSGEIQENRVNVGAVPQNKGGISDI